MPENFLRATHHKTLADPQPSNAKVSSDVSSEFEEIITLFPKNYRNRAKSLIHYLKNHIELKNGRVIYSDGSIGSHLLDLIKYYVFPSALKVPRPIDAAKFGILLKQLDVPNSVVGRSLVLKRENLQPTNKPKSNGNV